MPQLEINDAAELDYMWRNNGLLPNEDTEELDEAVRKRRLQDALAVPNAPMMFPKVINRVVREAIEPMLVGTSLLQRIDYSYGQTITFGATGGLEAADVAEGQEYPEQQLDFAGGTVTATIGKSGVAVKVTEEMVRYSQFDVIGMHLRAAGRALARHKETKIFNLIRNEGVTIFDNAEPDKSLKGVTTGRSFDGTANGSMTMDDLFDAWAHILMQGFRPNTLIMHPLTWTMFVKDSTMRHFVLQNGGGSFFGGWNGNPMGGFPAWGPASQNGMGVPTGQPLTPANSPSGNAATPTGEQSQTQDGEPQLPPHAGFLGNLAIVVSPYVPFDADTQLTDVYLCDRQELGFLIVDEDPTTEDFDDPARDIRKVKIRERYALAINNAGLGVGVIRNVKVVPNEITLPGQVQIDGSSVSTIPAGTPVV